MSSVKSRASLGRRVDLRALLLLLCLTSRASSAVRSVTSLWVDAAAGSNSTSSRRGASETGLGPRGEGEGEDLRNGLGPRSETESEGEGGHAAGAAGARRVLVEEGAQSICMIKLAKLYEDWFSKFSWFIQQESVRQDGDTLPTLVAEYWAVRTEILSYNAMEQTLAKVAAFGERPIQKLWKEEKSVIEGIKKGWAFDVTKLNAFCEGKLAHWSSQNLTHLQTRDCFALIAKPSIVRKVLTPDPSDAPEQWKRFLAGADNRQRLEQTVLTAKKKEMMRPLPTLMVAEWQDKLLHNPARPLFFYTADSGFQLNVKDSVVDAFERRGNKSAEREIDEEIDTIWYAEKMGNDDPTPTDFFMRSFKEILSCEAEKDMIADDEVLRLVMRMDREVNGPVELHEGHCVEKAEKFCAEGMSPQYKRQIDARRASTAAGSALFVSQVVGVVGGLVVGGIVGAFATGTAAAIATGAVQGVGWGFAFPGELFLPPIAFAAGYWDWQPSCRCFDNPCVWDASTKRCSIQVGVASTKNNPFQWLPYPTQKCIGQEGTCTLRSCEPDDYSTKEDPDLLRGLFGVIGNRLDGVYNCLSEDGSEDTPVGMLHELPSVESNLPPGENTPAGRSKLFGVLLAASQ